MQRLFERVYPHKNQFAQDAYDSLVTCLFSCDPVPRVICVTGNAPGVGKTTISINLAISFAMTGRKALLVDSDIRKDHAYKRLSGADFLGLTDYLMEPLEPADIITRTNMNNMSVITCGKTSIRNPLGLLYSPKFDHLLEATTNLFDLVIVDTSSLDVNADSTVVAAKADGTFLVAEINDSAKALKRNIARLESMGANIIGTILNKIPRNEYRSQMEYYNYKHTGVRKRKWNKTL